MLHAQAVLVMALACPKKTRRSSEARVAAVAVLDLLLFWMRVREVWTLWREAAPANVLDDTFCGHGRWPDGRYLAGGANRRHRQQQNQQCARGSALFISFSLVGASRSTKRVALPCAQVFALSRDVPQPVPFSPAAAAAAGAASGAPAGPAAAHCCCCSSTSCSSSASLPFSSSVCLRLHLVDVVVLLILLLLFLLLLRASRQGGGFPQMQLNPRANDEAILLHGTEEKTTSSILRSKVSTSASTRGTSTVVAFT